MMKMNLIHRKKIHDKSQSVEHLLDISWGMLIICTLTLLGLSCNGEMPRQITTRIGIKAVLIPPGTFQMGSDPSEKGYRWFEVPKHQVTLTKPFYLGIYEVTQNQWKTVMGNNPSYLKGDDHPVEHVSWNEVQIFLQKLNAMGPQTYRLPTEAEWEYACRAGTTTRYSFGDDERLLDEHAWYEENRQGAHHPVGQKKPNPWRLYDMHGNVWEWCSDWYELYSSEPVVDPQGPETGPARVLRSGYKDRNLHCAIRYFEHPTGTGAKIGFRVVIEPKK